MALRINTIEYGWETNQSTVSGSTTYTSPSKSLNIAETSSRTFIAADLHIYVRDGISGTGGPNNHRTASIGLWVDNNYVTNSFEHSLGWAIDHCYASYQVNFKNHFNTYFTGSNHICQFTWQTPTGSMSIPWTNHAAKLLLTYQYEDSGLSTGTKTVKIPLDGNKSYLSTVTQSFGNDNVTGSSGFRNIPALNTWLPETNKNFKDIFFEIFTSDASNATTSVSMSLFIDSGSGSPRCTVSGSLNTAVYIYDIYNVSGTMDTATTHTLKAVSSRASRFTNTSPILNVTYTYDYSASSTIMNSIIVPVIYSLHDSFRFAYKTTNRWFYGIDIFIPESNVQLKTSAIISSWSSSGGFISTYDDGISYTINVGSINCGGIVFTKQFDSQSIGVTRESNTLNRGNNAWKFSENINLLGPGATINRYAIINYISDNLTPGKHNKTIYLPYTHSSHYSANSINLLLDNSVINGLSGLVTSSYYLNSVNRTFNYFGIIVNPFYVTHEVDYTGSYNSASFVQNFLFSGDTKLGNAQIFYNMDIFRKYPHFLETTENVKTEYFRNINQSETRVPSTITISVYDYITINHLNYAVSCSLQNTNFPSEVYDVYFYISGSNNRPISKLSLSGSSVNKSGSFDWYDNFQNIFAVCYTPEFGISNMLPANSGSHTIDFSTPAAGGEHSFTFIGG